MELVKETQSSAVCMATRFPHAALVQYKVPYLTSKKFILVYFEWIYVYMYFRLFATQFGKKQGKARQAWRAEHNTSLISRTFKCKRKVFAGSPSLHFPLVEQAKFFFIQNSFPLLSHQAGTETQCIKIQIGNSLKNLSKV